MSESSRHGRRKPRSGGRERGFTLIELMTTLTVLAIMLGIAVPSFRNFIAAQKVKTAAYELVSSMMLARSEAVKRNSPVLVTPGSAAAWAGGWAVSAGATTLQQQQAVAGVTITPKDPADPATAMALANMSFAASGRLAAKAYFEIAGTAATKCVKVDLSGIPSSVAGSCS